MIEEKSPNQNMKSNQPSGTPCSPTGRYTVSVWNSVSEVDSNAWNEIRCTEDLFTDLKFLQVLESTLAEVSKPGYLLVRNENQHPVALATCSVQVVDGCVLAINKLYRLFMRGLNRVAPFITRQKTLVCGLPISCAQSSVRVISKADGIEIEIPDVLRVMDNTLNTIAKKEKATCIVWKEFNQKQTEKFRSLQQLGYDRFDSLPMNLLEFQSPSYEEHLKTLSSKKRAEIRRCARKMQKNDIHILTTSDADTISSLLTEEIYSLYLSVVKQSETVFETLPRDFFLALTENLAENCEFTFLLDSTDSVRAFGCNLFAGDCYQALVCGIDYDLDRESELYFNILFRLVEDAFKQQKRTLLVGQNADVCKHWKLGTHQIPLSGYIKGTNWLMRKELGLFRSLLFPRRNIEFPKVTDD